MSHDTVPVPDYACEEHGEAFYTYRLWQSHQYSFHHIVSDDEVENDAELYNAVVSVQDGLKQLRAGELTVHDAEALAPLLRNLAEIIEDGL